MTTNEVLQAYRSLWRASHKAVRFAKPARYQVRDILRQSFRTEPASSFNQERVLNTCRFFKSAQTHNGIEHKIVKNLLLIRWWREHQPHHPKL